MSSAKLQGTRSKVYKNEQYENEIKKIPFTIVSKRIKNLAIYFFIKAQNR